VIDPSAFTSASLSSAVVRRELDGAPEPPDAFERLRAGAWPWLLDSALRSERLGRHSFAGADPWAVVRAWGDRVVVDVLRAVRPGLRTGRSELTGDPFAVAQAWTPRAAPDGAPDDVPFVGGAVAVLGYELAERIEAFGLRGVDDRGLPDLTLLCVDRLVAWDHVRGRAWSVGLGFGDTPETAREAASRAADGAVEWLAGDARPGATPASEPPPVFDEFALDEAAYAKRIERVQDEIAAGNVYQACLTRRERHPFVGDPWRLYRALRRANPAPFACYLELPDAAVVGSSPERFLKLDPDGRVESRPIKGTRPRGVGATEDALLRSELAGSVKDRAENLMIVDLVRNDLGRVCERGSIEVPELMVIEAYEAVFQMVSTVTGRLREGCDFFDLLKATFPPGSMTGAPKIAAMRLLGRLEPVRRGFYSGAIGYLDVRGGADLSVVIRTAVVDEGALSLHTGGGIVADSEPDAEWVETRHKVRPLLEALAAAVTRKR
jgi:aminodeoxychorismate synthase component I